MSSASAPVPNDHPLMVAWRAYLSTEDFANTRRWVDEGDESAVDGSLWAVFEQGWRAAGGLAPFEDRPRPEWMERFAWLSHPDVMQTIAEDPSVILSVQRGIRELLHEVDFWRDSEAAQAHAAVKCEQEMAAMRENEAWQLRNLSGVMTGGNAGTWAEIEHSASGLAERNRELRAELETAADRDSARIAERLDLMAMSQRVATLNAALRGILATWDAEDQQDGDNYIVLERAITAARAALTGAGPAGSK